MHTDQQPLPIVLTLRDFPLALRMLLTAFLVTIGPAYLIALFYLFQVDVSPHQKMGMTPSEGIMMKYFGRQGSSRFESALRGTMADKIGPSDQQALTVWLRQGAKLEGFDSIRPIIEEKCMTCHSASSGLPIPSLTSFDEVKKLVEVDKGVPVPQLAKVSHVHLFGLSLVFFVTAGLFYLTTVPMKWRITVMVAPYLALWSDIASWWITKLVPSFSYVVLFAGGLMGMALAAQILLPMLEMWRPRTAID